MMDMDSGLISSFVGEAADDSFEDVCSICLDPFNSLDPPCVTKCKHDYHLHCILEWSQRRNDCPICQEYLVLKDPASQVLLGGMGNDMKLRLKSSSYNQDNEASDDDPYSDSDSDSDSDIEQRIMRRFATIATRARNLSARRKQTTPEVGPSQILPDHQNPTPAFSESLKSKLSTASIKYKESISKSTQSLKEKLAASNDSVKELGREVQREISSSIAGIIDTVKTLRRQ